MLEVLKDGLPHDRGELHACLGDELAPFSAVRVHITYLRHKLRPKGQDIICESVNQRFTYRWARTLLSPDD